jgi:hypothetical protein
VAAKAAQRLPNAANAGWAGAANHWRQSCVNDKLFCSDKKSEQGIINDILFARTKSPGKNLSMTQQQC